MITNCSEMLPDVHISVNCDTVLAINLRELKIGENDEFVFTIKNYDYINSSYVFIFRAKLSDADQNGEVVFKIPASASKRLKHGAFYTIATLINALDTKKETVYSKLADKGNIILGYGMQDLIESSNLDTLNDFEIVSMRLEPLNSEDESAYTTINDEVIGMRLELLNSQ